MLIQLINMTNSTQTNSTQYFWFVFCWSIVELGSFSFLAWAGSSPIGKIFNVSNLTQLTYTITINNFKKKNFLLYTHHL